MNLLLEFVAMGMLREQTARRAAALMRGEELPAKRALRRHHYRKVLGLGKWQEANNGLRVL